MPTLNDILSTQDWDALSAPERLRVLEELRDEIVTQRDAAAISIRGGALLADTPMGQMTFPLRLDNVTLRPGDTLQVTWTYDGLAPVMQVVPAT